MAFGFKKINYLNLRNLEAEINFIKVLIMITILILKKYKIVD